MNSSASWPTGSARELPSLMAISPPPAGRAGEDLLEPLQGADVAVAGGRLRDAERPGGLRVGELLEVPQGQDLAVELVHAVERLLEADLQLDPGRRMAGRGLLADEP